MLHSNFLICIQGGNGLEILGNGAMTCSKGRKQRNQHTTAHT